MDSEARELRRGERRVELSPKAFELLATLLAARPRALSQAELRDHLWPGVFVAYTSLARLVTEIRKAIGDDRREPRFVRTVHGFGYAFQGETKAAGPSPPPGACGFALLWGQRVVGLPSGEAVIGRGLDCALQIASSKVSRKHARILVSDGGATLEDLASKHGTWVNGRRIDGPESLADGDQIGVGNAVVTFRVVSSQTETE